MKFGAPELLEDEEERMAVEAFVRTFREGRKPPSGMQASAQVPQPGQYTAPPQALQTQPVQYVVSQQAVPQMPPPVLQSVPVQAAAGIGNEVRPSGTADMGAGTDGYTTSYASVGVRSAMLGPGTGDKKWDRVEVLQPGGTGTARVERLTTEPHVAYLAQHVQGELVVPGPGGGKPERVNVLLDSGSGVTSISEELISKMMSASPGVSLVRPFQGSARVRNAFGKEQAITHETTPLLLTLATPWGSVRFQLPFVVLPGLGDLLIVGQVTLQEILKVDVMGMLRQTVLEVRGNGGGESGLEWAGTKDTPLCDGGDVVDTRVGPIMCGRQTVHLRVEAFGAESSVVPPDQAEEVAVKENLLQRSPRMFMDVEEERRMRDGALAAAVDAARKHGLTPECGERLRRMVLDQFPEAFRRALCGDPPAQVEPMIARRKPGAGVVRARPRNFPPRKAEWLAEHFGQLEAVGMVFHNPQAVFSSVAMAVPKGNGFRMVADYRAVNQLVEQAAMPMPRLEELGMLLGGAAAFCTLDMIQGYWQMPLHESARELFTMVTTGGLYTPTRVPQGVLNATAYFQATMAEVLTGLIGKTCFVWVDDVVVWAMDQEELLGRLEAILARLVERGLFVAAHKAVFFRDEIKWCGRLYSGEATLPDPDRV